MLYKDGITVARSPLRSVAPLRLAVAVAITLAATADASSTTLMIRLGHGAYAEGNPLARPAMGGAGVELYCAFTIVAVLVVLGLPLLARPRGSAWAVHAIAGCYLAAKLGVAAHNVVVWVR